MYTEKEIQDLAKKIRNSDEWVLDDLRALCEAAGMIDEFEAADGETFESVVYAAAAALHVDVISHLGDDEYTAEQVIAMVRAGTELPFGLEVNGDLDLSYEPVTKLPDSMRIYGCLNLCGTDISVFPDNLMVEDALLLRNTKITEIPYSFFAGGGIDLQGSKIERLPDAFERDCGDEGMTIMGYLDLSDTPIKELPPILTVKGYLDLSNTQISELPEWLTVEGDLILSGTPITTLPDHLSVDGTLILSDTKIEEVPKECTVGAVNW